MNRNFTSKRVMNLTFDSTLPFATDKDLETLDDIIENWNKSNELLDDETLNSGDVIIQRPIDFMLSFCNFQTIPFTPYVLYIDEEGKQAIYDKGGKILVPAR